ncbi:hypothetical protein CANMA_000706 [Candida margitis]|uniref:uncharacterized protein n=1 Tax=Candida margitis TaxID=1775924 RepID=UPI00222747F1|nr:uncharacterized protein CANMA_000706 [Candida margitis]KAI5970095.1 hypothetical protein CANMA_000706 [Candida margitis]
MTIQHNLPIDDAANSNPNNVANPSNEPHTEQQQQPLPPIIYPKRKRKRQLFTKDVENLLYAMGDRPYSLDPTVSALEDILVDFISRLSHTMVHYAASQGRNRIKLNDLAFALRNDPLKLGRMLYILEQSQKIEKAKKLFDEEQGGSSDKKGGAFGKIGDDDDEDDDGDGDGEDDGDGDGEGEGEGRDGEGEGGGGTDGSGKKKKKVVELDENGKPKKRKYKKRKVDDGSSSKGTTG